MSMSQHYAKLVKDNLPLLQGARKRLDAVRAARVPGTLGEDERRAFVAAANPDFDAIQASHAEIKAEYEQLISGATVLQALKRSAIVRVGVVVCFCNRFGVCTYLLPSDLPIGSHWLSQESVPDFCNEFTEALGAFSDGRDGHDRLFNYTQLKTHAVHSAATA